MRSVLNKAEQVLGVDINGDGMVGGETGAVLKEIATLRQENLRLYHYLKELRIDPVRELHLSPRTTALLQSAEELQYTRRQAFAQVPARSHSLELYEQSPAPLEVTVDWSQYRRPAFGLPVRDTFFHLKNIFLNAASYGATPKPVLEARKRWEELAERFPYQWQWHILPNRLNQALNRLATELGANPRDMQFIINANTATATVLKSLPWVVGDRLLMLSCDYDATKLAAKHLEENYGTETVFVTIKLPMTDAEILVALQQKLEECQGNLPRLANFCHVTSKTAWVFPVREMTELCHRFGVPVCIDGAQAPGHIALNINHIGADYYIGTVHKWMYSCQGCAFIVVQPEKQHSVEPLVASSFRGQGYEKEFRYTGMFEASTWVSVIQAFEFVDFLGGWAVIREYCHSLAGKAVAYLEREWGTKVVQGSPEKYGSLPIVPLPNGKNAKPSAAVQVMAYLMAAPHNITAFLLVEEFDGVPTLCIRITCQIFLDMDDITRLAEAVRKLEGDYGALNVVTSLVPEAVKQMTA
eukprot:GGOE01042872.1.p1 GENE.GGOE01042872.1~~GGOE01042872.1.p1  ORF type:complete len:526 (+),score=191.49 GGOE01042872.1:65-1642(+)